MMPSRKPGQPAPLSIDTDPAVEQLVRSLHQAMTPAVKLHRVASASAALSTLASAGIARRHRPGAGGLALADLRLGRDLARRAYASSEPHDASAMDHLDVVLHVTRALDHCGVQYVVGGSLASSVSGEPRATLDVDMMVDLGDTAIACVAAALGDAFYVDDEALRRAVLRRTSANIVHLPTATKVDLFVMGALPIEREQMERRQWIDLGERGGIYVYTPEDILLQKLHWYRLGGEVSDRQWRDIIAIVRVQGQRLDLDYLRKSAASIAVVDLLEQALAV